MGWLRITLKRLTTTTATAYVDGAPDTYLVSRFRPWERRQIDRRVRRMNEYLRLVREIGAESPDHAAHHEARAHLDAQMAVDALDAAERNTDTIAIATWALVAMTAALVFATIALIVTTATH